MSKKKIEPTVAMILDAASTGAPLGTDARAVLTAALNHPDAPGLFADEDDRPWESLGESDQVCVGDEVKWDYYGLTMTATVARVDKTGSLYTAAGLHVGVRSVGTWHVRRAIQELPTEDGVEIVPAGGGPIGAAHPGGKFTTHHATYDSYLGSWVGVWRAASGRVTVSSVSPGDITPGTWKVEGE